MLRPNPPKVVTVVLAVALTVVGLAAIYWQPGAIDLVQALNLPRDVERQVISLLSDQIAAWVALAASPALLIVGSLLPGI